MQSIIKKFVGDFSENRSCKPETRELHAFIRFTPISLITSHIVRACHLVVGIDSLSTVLFYIISDYRFRKDEIFKRMKITTLVHLVSTFYFTEIK